MTELKIEIGPNAWKEERDGVYLARDDTASMVVSTEAKGSMEWMVVGWKRSRG